MTTMIWDRIKEAFQGAGLPSTQIAIARALGIGQSAVGKWSSGTGNPTTKRVLEIARITGYSALWILSGQGEKRLAPGNDVDPLTAKLLEAWASANADLRREVVEYLRFRLKADNGRNSGNNRASPRPPPKQHK